MSTHHLLKESRQIYRIDKFVVPSSARTEFLDKVKRTHEFLRTVPGFVQDHTFEQTGGPGEFNVVTIARWDSVESIEAARKAVMARHEAMGFNPQEMVARLGIKADLASYRQVDAEPL
jgi:heme-degrading monooxygenase HmoA